MSTNIQGCGEKKKSFLISVLKSLRASSLVPWWASQNTKRSSVFRRALTVLCFLSEVVRLELYYCNRQNRVIWVIGYMAPNNCELSIQKWLWITLDRIINYILVIFRYIVISYKLHLSCRTQSIVRLGLPGLVVSMRAFGIVPSIRNFILISMVLEIMVISSTRPLN